MVGVMMILFLKAALPVDEEYEARLPMIEENAKKRMKAFKEMQKEASCKDDRFIGSEYCESDVP